MESALNGRQSITQITAFTCSLLSEAGEIALKLFEKRLPATTKGSIDDTLSPADTVINEFLVSKIKKEYPLHQVYSEESSWSLDLNNGPTWIIDPLDGSRNFAHGIGYWCIMIAIIDSGHQIVFGAIHDPFQRKTYYASIGSGLLINGLRVPTATRPKNLLKSLGIAVADPSGVQFLKYHHFVSSLLKETGWIHNHGSMLSAVHVAEGGLSFLVNNYGYLYDYAAAVIICKEAGLIVTNSSGRAWEIGDRDIVIAPPDLHSDIMRLMVFNT